MASFLMPDEQPMGLYSKQAAERVGTVIWADEDGREFEITAVMRPSEYCWPDAIVVAPVDHFVRLGNPARGAPED
jgi:hypothetical protein